MASITPAQRASFKKYYIKNRERRIAYQKRRYVEHRDTILAQMAISGARARRRERMLAIDAYGGKCACCEETKLEFLTIDHINGGGSSHRTKLGGGKQAHFYAKLRKLNYPNDPPLRVLCFNCNMATRYSGVCPHKQEAAI